jgi:hypothetical protein
MSTLWTGSVFQKTSYTPWAKPQLSLAISILQNILLHLFCTSSEGEKVVSLWAECKKCNMGLCTVAYKTTTQNWNADISTKGKSSELQNLLLHEYVIRQVCYPSSNMILNKHMDTKIWHIAATSIWSNQKSVFMVWCSNMESSLKWKIRRKPASYTMNIPLALEFSAVCTLQNTSNLNVSSLPGTFLVNKFSAYIVFPASQC